MADRQKQIQALGCGSIRVFGIDNGLRLKEKLHCRALGSNPIRQMAVCDVFWRKLCIEKISKTNFGAIIT
jgi:hypothetical protein